MTTTPEPSKTLVQRAPEVAGNVLRTILEFAIEGRGSIPGARAAAARTLQAVGADLQRTAAGVFDCTAAVVQACRLQPQITGTGQAAAWGLKTWRNNMSNCRCAWWVTAAHNGKRQKPRLTRRGFLLSCAFTTPCIWPGCHRA